MDIFRRLAREQLLQPQEVSIDPPPPPRGGSGQAHALYDRAAEFDDDDHHWPFGRVMYGKEEKKTRPARTAEMHQLLQSMDPVDPSKPCPKCTYGKVLVSLAWRYYFEGYWSDMQPGHSEVAHYVMLRRCPQCGHAWKERPADYEPPKETPCPSSTSPTTSKDRP